MYFDNCKTLDELKSVYRRLAIQHHPDTGHGDENIMKAINAENDRVFEILKAENNARADAEQAQRDAGTRTETYTRRTTESAEEFRTIIDLLLHLDGLTVELCGCWLWISGETQKHKDALKAAKCQWSANKKMWYWRHPEDGASHNHHTHNINYIRTKYGSQTFTACDEAISA